MLLLHTYLPTYPPTNLLQWFILWDERTFSTLNFMKTRLWNKLCEKLDLVVRMYMQPYFTFDIFPYHDAIITWIEEKTQKGLLA